MFNSYVKLPESSYEPIENYFLGPILMGYHQMVYEWHVR